MVVAVGPASLVVFVGVVPVPVAVAAVVVPATLWVVVGPVGDGYMLVFVVWVMIGGLCWGWWLWSRGVWWWLRRAEIWSSNCEAIEVLVEFHPSIMM